MSVPSTEKCSSDSNGLTLPVVVELAAGVEASESLAREIEQAIRAKLVVGARVELVAYGALPRSEYKSKLVDFSAAGG
jgi:phenylacetate-CoA ligase